ncbi:MAG: ATP-dependent zinc metalloprotease FtsH [Elusimicrobia bacterium]|nr:ATP-dependent zinc metalloprotease FtsH [Elusimicrobiota bacterium]
MKRTIAAALSLAILHQAAAPCAATVRAIVAAPGVRGNAAPRVSAPAPIGPLTVTGIGLPTVSLTAPLSVPAVTPAVAPTGVAAAATALNAAAPSPAALPAAAAAEVAVPAPAPSFKERIAEALKEVRAAARPKGSAATQAGTWSAFFDRTRRTTASGIDDSGPLRHVPMPVPYRDEYTKGLKPAIPEANDVTEYHPELPPVLKIIAELRRLEESDLPAAVARAKELLADPVETRPQVRLSAVRLAAKDASTELLTALVSTDRDWYIKREAALALGGWSAAHPKSSPAPEYAAALSQAAMDEIPSVRLAARAALTSLGIDAPAEPPSDFEVLEAKKKEAARLQKENDPFGYGYQPPPQGLQPGWQKRLKTALIGAAIIGGLLWMMSSMQTTSSTPVRTPPPIVQPYDGPSHATIDAPRSQAPSTRQAARPEPPAQAQPQGESKVEKFFWNFGPTILIIAAIGFFVMLAAKARAGAAGGLAALKGGKAAARTERPTTRFKDVAGIDDAVIELQEVVDFLRNPAKYKRLGAKIPKGVLMEGPPGTGKTLSAKAVAGEAKASFFSISGSDFIELFVGVGASRVRELFAAASADAPAIIFIDEIDAVGKARSSGASSQGSHDEREQTINALLAAMDGFDNSKGVIVIAATNRADTLDPALRRPGRFDRTVHVGQPDQLGREAILTVHAKSVRLAADASLHDVARRTAGLTGAYMANIINEGALLAARRGHDAITNADLALAVDRAIVGQARDLYMPDALKRKIAYHEAGHVLAMMKSKAPNLPNKVTIVPHGSGALGYAEWGSEEDALLRTRDELKARMVGGLGGLAAELKVYGQGSTGPGNDLERANEIARAMVAKLGMSEKLGLLTQLTDKESPLGHRLTSEATARLIDREVRRLLDEAMAEAAGILRENAAAHEALVDALMKDETIFREDIERIVAAATPAGT